MLARARASTAPLSWKVGFTGPSVDLENAVHDGDRLVDHGHRDTLDTELRAIRAGVVRMGDGVARSIERAMVALEERDCSVASEVVASDAAIDRAQAELTALTITTIATQAPVARDLQLLLSLSHVTYELERIGDHAADVARQLLRMAERDGCDMPSLGGLVDLAGIAAGSLHGTLVSLVDLDAIGARSFAARDDDLDKAYHAYFQRTLERMREDPSWVDTGAHLLFAAKDLERIGDRVTNIAEEVVFLATGEVEDLNP